MTRPKVRMPRRKMPPAMPPARRPPMAGMMPDSMNMPPTPDQSMQMGARPPAKLSSLRSIGQMMRSKHRRMM